MNKFNIDSNTEVLWVSDSKGSSYSVSYPVDTEFDSHDEKLLLAKMIGVVEKARLIGVSPKGFLVYPIRHFLYRYIEYKYCNNLYSVTDFELVVVA